MCFHEVQHQVAGPSTPADLRQCPIVSVDVDAPQRAVERDALVGRPIGDGDDDVGVPGRRTAA